MEAGVLWKLSLVVAFWLNWHKQTAATVIIVDNTCKIPISDLQDTENTKYGIVLRPDPWKLKTPGKGVYTWRVGEPVYIGCRDAIRRKTCYYNKIKASDFICNHAPSVDFKSTNRTCAATGTQYEVGFTVNQSEFIPYYNVCFNNKDCSVLFTSQRLWRGYFNTLAEIPRLNNITTSPFSCDIDYNALYLQSNQQSNPRINITSDQYLQSGHLFPERDASVYSWKLATYSYGNSAPMWKSINSNGNWYELESLVSEMAKKRLISFNIFDGVLYDPIPQNKIYLNQSGAKVEVPQWVYKVVINSNENAVPGYPAKIVNEDMIFFVYNNPYSFPANKFCTRSRCSDYFWRFEYNQVKGWTHCCLYADLKKDTLPKEVLEAFGSKSTGLYFSKGIGK